MYTVCCLLYVRNQSRWKLFCPRDARLNNSLALVFCQHGFIGSVAIEYLSP